MNLSKKFIASIVFTFLLTFNTICLAENASNDEDYSARIAYYTMMIEKNPNDGDMYFNRALAYSIIGGNINAINDYSKAIELNPDDAEAYFNRGFLYYNVGETKKLLRI